MSIAVIWLTFAAAAIAACLALVVLLQNAFGKPKQEPYLTQFIVSTQQQLTTLDRLTRDEFQRGRDEAGTSARSLREEMLSTLVSLGETIRGSIAQLGDAQNERLALVTQNLQSVIQGNETRQDSLRLAVENRLEQIRTENSEKLESIRQTVDEKLQGTLEQRLGASFKIVSEQLEAVHRSVGEMQSLAAGVGDLKRVLSNVKTRGTWGEVSLANLLEQFLAREQYQTNVEIRPGSNQRVEFAVRLPGGEDAAVWLPIDAKFPVEDYERLVDAAERGDSEAVEAATRALEVRIKASAREIRDKYVVPPYSTDFGIMFLPTEGLFAEVIRRPGLSDALQRECRVIVTGPTTLAAVLTSLRMGFRSLAIQKRSGEVWRVLGAVKTEFAKFETVLEKISRKLHEAQSAVDEAAPRRRAMNRKLREVEELPEIDAARLIQIPTDDELEADSAEESGAADVTI